MKSRIMMPIQNTAIQSRWEGGVVSVIREELSAL
jgi:hypothetical protein